MNQKELAIKAQQKFQTADGKIVDVIFGTSDGEMHYKYADAKTHANTLPDKNIYPFYKDSEVRKMAEQYIALKRMVIVTDFVKLSKVENTIPTYEEYTQYCEDNNYEAVDVVAFKFVVSKVFSRTKLVMPGQKDQIFTYNYGIVPAIFIRKYPQGIIWSQEDRLVFTCPTHTELMSGTYEHIFKPMLDQVPVPAK